MSAFKLPAELVDYIVDLIRHNRTTLLSCSLVSWDWSSSSRPHIFGYIEVNAWNYRGFVKLQQSPLCTFRPYIRSLTFLGTQSDFLNQLLPLTGFTSVKSLRIYGLGPLNLYDGLETSLSSSFPGVKELTLAGMCYDLSRIVPIACAFSLLQRVELECIGDTRRVEFLSSVPLSCLIIVSRWIMSLAEAPPIHTVQIVSASMAELPFVHELLQTLEKPLQHLHLCFNDLHGQLTKGIYVNPYLLSPQQRHTVLAAHYLTLRHHTNLRSITLHENRWHVDGKPGHVQIILSQITSPNLENIVIRSAFTLRGVWSGLDRILRLPQFSKLNRVTLLGCSGRSTSIRELMPECDGRGILDFG
jgi:hypothetical protein